MHWAPTTPRRVSRRDLLRATIGRAAPARAQPAPPAGAPSRSRQPSDPLLRALDEKIQAAMAQHQIPGVAVGMYYQGQEYVRGYGVTNVDYPQPVDGDTLFRIGSTAKTFTGTTTMRLVEQGPKNHLQREEKEQLHALFKESWCYLACQQASQSFISKGEVPQHS